MKRAISKKQLRKFGFLLGFGIPILIGFLLPFIFEHPFKFWTLYVGIPFFIFGVAKPDFLLYPYKIWMIFGLLLGWINSRLILGLVFVLIVQPISLAVKLCGYDPLRRKFSSRTSYREDKRDHKIDLKRIF